MKFYVILGLSVLSIFTAQKIRHAYDLEQKSKTKIDSTLSPAEMQKLMQKFFPKESSGKGIKSS
jgi:hypothetical protein